MDSEGTQQQIQAEVANLDFRILAVEGAMTRTRAAMAQHQAIVEEVRAKRRVALAKAKRRRWLRRHHADADAAQIPTEAMLQNAEALYRRVQRMVEARQTDLEALRLRRLKLARQIATLT